MILLKSNCTVLFVISLFCVLAESPNNDAQIMNRRKRIMMNRRMGGRGKLKPTVCYDLVGCFADPPPHLTLKRPPEHPDIINTRFLLYTSSQKQQDPEILVYGDGLRSIGMSSFNETKKVKVIIHGFKGSGSDEGAILGARSFLEVEDANVMILDWTRGAGTTYGAAVANTELVGRQLSLILLDMISLGTDPKDLHAIGFSLGAHVAGCASEVLKKRNFLIGRITGLDPASPFFRHHILRERARKLDKADAHLVDVIHTDGSVVFTDGFGLFKPIGHVDFFPNGGKEQPGCTDLKNSVVVSHFHEDALDRSIACSHLRAWKFFVESIRSQLSECRFAAWSCPHGASSFARGTCFPRRTLGGFQEMGYKADHGTHGIFYLATRDDLPYCGEPLRAAVTTSKSSEPTRGILYLKIAHKNSSTTFGIRCNLIGRNSARSIFYNIAAAEFGAFPENSTTCVIQGTMRYEITTEDTEENTTVEPYSATLKVDKLTVEDRRGNGWEYSTAETKIGDMEEVDVELYSKTCIP